MILKVLSPVVKLFFNEKRNRQKSATKILREKRGVSRIGILKFAVQRNVMSLTKRNSARGTNYLWTVMAGVKFLVGRIGVDMVRFMCYWSLRIVLFYPVVTIRRIFKRIVPSSTETRTNN
mmetsp:Transcript_44529/g.50281  ORF Transcript_44529/g.50281 Transcript_44529/m.50281 type:complete len:120 (+) Transcript_44529:99-458(+)